jgi:YD repeat-containing protein
MPGRIPLGFNYFYDSLDPLHIYNSGDVRPVVWTGYASKRLMYTVLVNGEPWNFSANFQPTTPLSVNWQNILQSREGSDGYQDAINEGQALGLSPVDFQFIYFPSGDGTKFLLISWWRMRNNSTQAIGTAKGGRRYSIIDGPNTIWSSMPDDQFTATKRGVTHYQTQWGDHLTVTENNLTYPQPPSYLSPSSGSINGSIVIKNEKATDQYLTLTITGSGSTATLTVIPSQGIRLPSVSATGTWAFQRRSSYDLGYQVTENIWDLGFRLETATVSAGGESVTTRFTWGTVPLTTRRQLSEVQYPNGSKDLFYYECLERKQLGKFAFNPLTGVWMGFTPTFQGQWPPAALPATMVSRMVMKDATGTNGNQTIFARTTPEWVNNSGTVTWSQKNHSTTIIVYPAPSTTGTPRGVRLIHPSYNGPTSGTWGGPNASETDQRAAYLFATSAVVQAEFFSGGGPSGPSGSGCELWTEQAGGTVDRTITTQGWDLRSWGNPQGTVSSSLPVIAKPTGITIYRPNLPTQIRVLGRGGNAGWDDYGPKQSDEGSNPPSTVISLSGLNTGTWGGGSLAPASNINFTTKSSRSWHSNLMVLQTTQMTSELNGSQVSSLRQGAASPQALDTVTYGFNDPLGRLKSVQRSIGSSTVLETRQYVGTNPQPEEISFTVSEGGNALPFSGNLGKSIGYGPSPHFWVTSETDKLTGQTVSYVPDALGRVTQVTDPHGVVTTTDYDDWGRLYVVTRKAKGLVPALTTTYTYDPLGAWSNEKVVSGAITLNTKKEFDDLGRLVKITNPDLSYKIITYTGFGEKKSETPWIKVGQTVYGQFTTSYDSKGRPTSETDPQGRTIWSMPNDPAWNSGLSRVSAVINDDQGRSITQRFDLLGQKTQLVDQKAQTTSYTFNKFGHLAGATIGSQTRAYTHNDFGWMTSSNEPEEGLITFSEFTAWGAPGIRTQKGRSGQSTLATRIVYDALGRPDEILDNTTGLKLRDYIYHATLLDLIDHVVDTQPNGVVTERYGYDDLARLNSKTIQDETGQAFTVSRELDAWGNVATLTYPAGGDKPTRTLVYGYDGLNRLKDLTLGGNRAHMDYDQAVSGSSSSNTLTFGNGTTTKVVVDKGELKRITHSIRSTPGSALTAIEDRALSWTAGGVLTNRGSDEFGYDELGRLKTATTFGFATESISQTFDYDAYGNRNSATATASGIALPSKVIPQWSAVFSASNQLPNQVTAGAATLLTGVAYDDFGRLLETLPQPSSGGYQSTNLIKWTYDLFGRVVSESGTKFLLDASGLRFRRVSQMGLVTYVVYGFERDPLSTFEVYNTALRGRAESDGPVLAPVGHRPTGHASERPNR